MAISVNIPGWRFRRELLMSGVSALAVVRGAQAGVRSYRTGHHGRRSLDTALAALPVAWQYLPAVRVDGHPCAVVAGPNGVFLLDVKQAGGHVVAHSTGLSVRRKRDVRIVAEARRRAERLGEAVGREVKPVIVICGGTVEGTAAGRVPVVAIDHLLGFLVSAPGALARSDLLPMLDALATLGD